MQGGISPASVEMTVIEEIILVALVRLNVLPPALDLRAGATQPPTTHTYDDDDMEKRDGYRQKIENELMDDKDVDSAA